MVEYALKDTRVALADLLAYPAGIAYPEPAMQYRKYTARCGLMANRAFTPPPANLNLPQNGCAATAMPRCGSLHQTSGRSARPAPKLRPPIRWSLTAHTPTLTSGHSTITSPAYSTNCPVHSFIFIPKTPHSVASTTAMKWSISSPRAEAIFYAHVTPDIVPGAVDQHGRRRTTWPHRIADAPTPTPSPTTRTAIRSPGSRSIRRCCVRCGRRTSSKNATL